MRGRRVTLGRFRLQAAQNNFLKPLGQLGLQLARRRRVHPQTLANAAFGLRCAKGQLARGQLVQHDANGKNIAAGVAAHPHYLLGRNPGRGTHGLAQLLGQQIGVQRIARETKIKQHRAAIGANQHVGRL